MKFFGMNSAGKFTVGSLGFLMTLNEGHKNAWKRVRRSMPWPCICPCTFASQSVIVKERRLSAQGDANVDKAGLPLLNYGFHENGIFIRLKLSGMY